MINRSLCQTGCVSIRTTLTLDDDLAAALQELSKRSGQAFSAVVNQTLRRGLSTDFSEKMMYTVPTFSLGANLIFENRLPSEIIQEIEDQNFIKNL